MASKVSRTAHARASTSSRRVMKKGEFRFASPSIRMNTAGDKGVHPLQAGWTGTSGAEKSPDRIRA